ncbi:MAG: bacterioferritin [Rickettsiales bacterium]|nr:bacterioferritin [Rickettsiales bacterium]
MQTDTKMIDHLNGILKNELTAINQYFLHSKILKNQGYNALADKAYEESIDEMKHADAIAERILYLGGLPNFQDLGKLLIGETAPEMLKADFKMEEKAIPDLKEAIAYADKTIDYGTVELLSGILVSEEEHYLWLKQQLGILDAIGEQNYLQSQV